jgi:competence protein ComEA
MMNRKHLNTLSFLCFALCLLQVLAAAAPAAEQSTEQPKGININTATAEQISKAVPEISMELAAKIVTYREENGQFQVLEELLQIDGFDWGLFMRVKPLLLLEGLGEGCGC